MSETLSLLLCLIWCFTSLFFLGYFIAQNNARKEIIKSYKGIVDANVDHIDTLMKWQEAIDYWIDKDRTILQMAEWVEKYVPITEKNKDEILKMLESWLSYWEIADKYWLNKSTIRKAIKRWNIAV